MTFALRIVKADRATYEMTTFLGRARLENGNFLGKA